MELESELDVLGAPTTVIEREETAVSKEVRHGGVALATKMAHHCIGREQTRRDFRGVEARDIDGAKVLMDGATSGIELEVPNPRGVTRLLIRDNQPGSGGSLGELLVAMEELDAVGGGSRRTAVNLELGVAIHGVLAKIIGVGSNGSDVIFEPADPKIATINVGTVQGIGSFTRPVVLDLLEIDGIENLVLNEVVRIQLVVELLKRIRLIIEVTGFDRFNVGGMDGIDFAFGEVNKVNVEAVRCG